MAASDPRPMPATAEQSSAVSTAEREAESADPSLHRADDQSDGFESAGTPVTASELNAWRRGFTPQAEIWNGRLAMLGLSLGLTVLLIVRLATA